MFTTEIASTVKVWFRSAIILCWSLFLIFSLVSLFFSCKSFNRLTAISQPLYLLRVQLDQLILNFNFLMVDQWFDRKRCIVPLASKVLFGKLLDGWECVLVLKISY
jgi:hypothetical protein